MKSFFFLKYPKDIYIYFQERKKERNSICMYFLCISYPFTEDPKVRMNLGAQLQSLLVACLSNNVCLICINRGNKSLCHIDQLKTFPVVPFPFPNLLLFFLLQTIIIRGYIFSFGDSSPKEALYLYIHPSLLSAGSLTL